MTVATSQVSALPIGMREAIVDQLRACKTCEQLLEFDSRFNLEANAGPLYLVICDFLHDRTISRALAAKWLRALLNDRESRLQAANQQKKAS